MAKLAVSKQYVEQLIGIIKLDIETIAQRAEKNAAASKEMRAEKVREMYEQFAREDYIRIECKTEAIKVLERLLTECAVE